MIVLLMLWWTLDTGKTETKWMKCRKSFDVADVCTRRLTFFMLMLKFMVDQNIK